MRTDAGGFVLRRACGFVLRRGHGLALRRACGRYVRAGALLAVVALSVTDRPVVAQASPLLVNPATTVRSVRLSFPDGQTFTTEQLSELLTYRDPGASAGVQRFFAPLPFVPDPGERTFVPIEFQRDLARLRAFYHSSGFPNARLSYEVRFDEERNVVHLRHIIREGEPLKRGRLDVVYPDGETTPTFMPEEMRAEWELHLQRMRPRLGKRLGAAEQAQLEDAAAGWLRNHGWAFAKVRADVSVDSTGVVAEVRLVTDPGPVTWVDAVHVEGYAQVSQWIVRRAIPLKAGHRFSSDLLVRGQQHLYGLDLIRFSRVDVLPDQPVDSTVTLRAVLEEAPPRLLSGEAGYATETGVTAEASWAHRDFFGGARTLTLAATAQTGLGLVGSNTTRYGGSVALRQPFVFDAASTGIGRPYVDYRDDLVDRSWEAGADFTLIYQTRPGSSWSAGYGWSERRVLEYRGGGGIDVDYLTRLAIADSLESNIRTSSLSLSWLTERVDNTRDPTSGHVLRAGLRLAGPAGISSVSYGRADLSAAGFLPLSPRITVAGRVSLGRLYPVGQSVPGPGADPLRSVLQLRSALFTAGGSYDVRGWGEQVLGPKTPDARGDLQNPASLTATRYVPIGGLARMQSTVELRMRMPVLGGQNGILGFLDSGRVWNPDARFPTGSSDDTRQFFSTGGGMQFATPIGPIRLVVGYKLNPSLLDLRDPNEVLRALVENRSILKVKEKSIRRYHLHLTLGRTF